MSRLSPVNRVRAITAAVAGGAMAVAVIVLVLADAIRAIGWLPGTAPILILATAGVAAWRAEEAVATSSPLGWAWGSTWRSLLVGALGIGLVFGVLVARASINAVPEPPPDAADLGVYYAFIVMFLSAPLPLVIGFGAHLLAALAVRRVVRRWWSWFAT